MSTKLVRGKTTRILVLNPNSSQPMTDALKHIIDAVELPASTEVHTYTASSESPASINDGEDIKNSSEVVLKNVEDFDNYDGILVACFSVHTLVPALQSEKGKPKAITGIFEASILTATALLNPGEKWGIVTTGKFWEQHLSDGVRDYLGASTMSPDGKFAGVASTGLTAGDFHHVDPEVVRWKLKAATKRILDGGKTTVIAMGCAGMAGLENAIREAAEEELGEHFAHSVLHVIDGVRVGIMQVDQMIKHNHLRRT